MTQKPTTSTESPDREPVSFWMRVRRGVLLMLGAVVMYLSLTGPMLWSYSGNEHSTWGRCVEIWMIPIKQLEWYDFEKFVEVKREEYYERILTEEGEHMCFFAGYHPPWWLKGLIKYWSLFGEKATSSYFKIHS